MAEVWKQGERDAALKMARQGFNFAEIGAELGRTKGSVRAFFRRGRYQLNHAAIAVKREQYKGRKTVYNTVMVLSRPKPAVLNRLFNERDMRANEPLTLSQTLCGDPPFSQSVLGKKLGSARSTSEPSAPAVAPGCRGNL